MATNIDIQQKVLDGSQDGPVSVEIDSPAFTGEVSIEDSLLNREGSEISLEISDNLGVTGLGDLLEIKNSVDNAVAQANTAISQAEQQIDKANEAVENINNSVQTINTAVGRAQTAANTATTKASEASTSASEASASATTASNSATAAGNSSTTARTAATDAQTAQTSVAATKTQIDSIKTQIDNSASTARQHAEAAEASKDSANSAAALASSVKTAVDAAKTSVDTAKAAVDTAKASVDTAKASVDTAKTAAETATATATTKASEALASKNTAETHARAAAASRAAAEAAKTTSEAKASIATTKANEATAAATTATTRAGEALANKNIAVTKASEALASKNSAETYASQALASKNAAETAETTATGRATVATTAAATATTKATEAETAKIAAETAKTAAEAAKSAAEEWATTKPNDNAKYWAEKAKEYSARSIISGGRWTPTSGNEYPSTTGITVDTIWKIGFPGRDDTYTFTSGALSGKVATNLDELMYDTPSGTWELFQTSGSAGIVSITTPNGGLENGPAVSLTPAKIGALTQATADGRYLAKLGTAEAAKKLEAARTFTLLGDVSGSATFDGSDNAEITVTVKDNLHDHTIANVTGLQNALDGKVANTRTINSKPLTADVVLSASDVGALPATTSLFSGRYADLSGLPAAFTPASHTHAWDQVTGKPVTATRWPAWGEVTGKPTLFSGSWDDLSDKPTSFAPTAHDHDWTQVNNKPVTATRWPAWGEVTGKPAFNTLYRAITDSYSKSEMDARYVRTTAALFSGDYNDLTNKPTIPTTAAQVHARPDTWKPSWGDVTGKPSQYTPTTHGHTWDQISGRPIYASRWPNWGEVSGKPTNLLTKTLADTYYLGVNGKAADAQLLDGMDSSRFVYGNNGFGTMGMTDLNVNRKSGFIEWDKRNGTNGPNLGTATWFWGAQMSYSNNSTGNKYGAQWGVGQDGNFYFRVQDSKGSGSWREAFHAGNLNASTINAYTKAQTYSRSEMDGRYLGKTATAANANKLGNVAATNFLRADTGDNFYGDLVSGSRNRSLFGNYSSTLLDQVWSMGNGLRILSNGTNYGSLTGLVFKPAGNTAGGTMAGGNQMVWTEAGTPTVSMGTNVWVKNSVIAGNLYEGSNRVYSPANKPRKGDVGLGNVQNWVASNSVSNASTTTYATANAVKTAYDACIKRSGQKYNIHDAWLRPISSGDNMRVYGGGRAMLFRTDGTSATGATGAVPFAWSYKTESDANNIMMKLSSSGDLYLKSLGGWVAPILNAKITQSTADGLYLGKTATAANANKLANVTLDKLARRDQGNTFAQAASFSRGVTFNGATSFNGIPTINERVIAQRFAGNLSSGTFIGGQGGARLVALRPNVDSASGQAILATNGNFSITGRLSQSSDRRLKDNIKPITNPTNKLMSISGNGYNRNDMDGEKQYGVIAQEVQDILPAAVEVNGEGNLIVDYAAVTALLVEGFKEQKKEIDALKEMVQALINK